MRGMEVVLARRFGFRSNRRRTRTTIPRDHVLRESRPVGHRARGGMRPLTQLLP
jgi:hypothetical protein